MAAEPRVFVIDRRDVAATGKGSEELTERFCAAAVRELNYNQPEAVSWVCRAALDGGHYVALFRKLRDGKPADRRMTHEATEKAAAAVRLGFVRSADPEALAAYEARTLEAADGAFEVDIPTPARPLQTIGRVFSIGYEGTLQGTTGPWRHTFEGNSGPVLFADQESRLFLLGGRYKVTDVGIEDGAPEELPGGFEAGDFPPVSTAPWDAAPSGMTEAEIFGAGDDPPF